MSDVSIFVPGGRRIQRRLVAPSDQSLYVGLEGIADGSTASDAMSLKRPVSDEVLIARARVGRRRRRRRRLRRAPRRSATASAAASTTATGASELTAASLTAPPRRRRNRAPAARRRPAAPPAAGRAAVTCRPPAPPLPALPLPPPLRRPRRPRHQPRRLPRRRRRPRRRYHPRRRPEAAPAARRTCRRSCWSPAESTGCSWRCRSRPRRSDARTPRSARPASAGRCPCRPWPCPCLRTFTMSDDRPGPEARGVVGGDVLRHRVNHQRAREQRREVLAAREEVGLVQNRRRSGVEVLGVALDADAAPGRQVLAAHARSPGSGSWPGAPAAWSRPAAAPAPERRTTPRAAGSRCSRPARSAGRRRSRRRRRRPCCGRRSTA